MYRTDLLFPRSFKLGMSYQSTFGVIIALMATIGCAPAVRVVQPTADTSSATQDSPPAVDTIKAVTEPIEMPADLNTATHSTQEPAAEPIAATAEPTTTAIPASSIPRQDMPKPSHGAAQIEVVVVCPVMFREALQPWVDRRNAEDLVVKLIDSQPTADQLAEAIREVVTPASRYLWLVGDTEHTPNREPVDAARFVPTRYLPADVSQPYQDTRNLPGDYGYGDFDQDGTIDAAVGRLPVHAPEQLTKYIGRLIAYEDQRTERHWQSRVDLIAGLGGFGAMIDGAIEFAAGSIVTGSLPGYVRTRITHAGPTSMFHPGAERFADQVLKNYADGGRFWVYAGHGWVNQLDRVPSTDIGRPILTTRDVSLLQRAPEQATIALLLACYTGAYDAAEDSLAEAMLLADQGPIAVIAGSRVTMPYANTAVAIALIHAIYKQRADRLGDAWLLSLQELGQPSNAHPELQTRRNVIDGLATLLGNPRLDDERREHRQLYNCLGDPTLRMNPPEELSVVAPSHLILDQGWTISGNAPSRVRCQSKCIAAWAVSRLRMRRHRDTTPPMKRYCSVSDCRFSLASGNASLNWDKRCNRWPASSSSRCRW